PTPGVARGWGGSGAGKGGGWRGDPPLRLRSAPGWRPAAVIGRPNERSWRLSFEINPRGPMRSNQRLTALAVEASHQSVGGHAEMTEDDKDLSVLVHRLLDN